jgi:hypothetical protein
VDPNGVQYSVNILTYSNRDYRTHGQAGQNGVQFSVNARHFDHNHNIERDAIPIIYAPLGLDVSRGSMRSAIPIGFGRPEGVDIVQSRLDKTIMAQKGGISPQVLVEVKGATTHRVPQIVRIPIADVTVTAYPIRDS